MWLLDDHRGKEMIVNIERGSTRSHRVEKWLLEESVDMP